MSSSLRQIRERFSSRLRAWWGPDADDVEIERSVDELLTDLGYVVRPPGLKRCNPARYREYQREYQRQRRAAMAERMTAAE